jgi:hypothetical protein
MKFSIKFEEIIFQEFPYKPSKLYPNGILRGNEIDSIVLGVHQPCVKTKYSEFILFPYSREIMNELSEFAKINNIPKVRYYDVWSDLLDIFLDIEKDKEHEKKVMKDLLDYGFTNQEIGELRSEIQDIMMSYNYDTLLWEWVNLGLQDLFDACTGKLGNLAMSEQKFEEYYWKIMRIQERGKTKKAE